MDVDIGARVLWALQGPMGAAGPCVVFEAGAAHWSADWALVQPALAGVVRTLAYDRAGLGRSDVGASPRTGSAISADLGALLSSLDVAGPVVLVAHSVGALYARAFQVAFPERVAGLVLIDPFSEYSGDLVPSRFLRG